MLKKATIHFVLLPVALLCMVLVSHKAFNNEAGTTGGYTNAPGESNCTSCHTGSSLITGSSILRMTINGTSSFLYKPDSTYTIAVGVAKSTYSKWGFQITAIKDSDQTFSGSFTTSANTVSLKTATISGKTRYYVGQSSLGTAGTGGRSWSFNWTAPHTNVGSITFYVTACSADGNSAASGDQIYANSFKLTLQPNNPIGYFGFTPSIPCNGDTVYFKDSSTHYPTSWSWSFPGGTPSSSTLKNPKVVYKTSGTNKITLTSANSDGSSVPVSKTITVNPRPLDTIYRNKKPEICLGDSVLLKTDYGDGYTWSTGAKTQLIWVKKRGNYSCTVSYNGCIRTTTPVFLNVHSKPTNILSRTLGGDTLCEGDTVKFKLKASGKFQSFYDNKNTIGSGLALSLGNLTGNGHHIYTIVTDSIGCLSDTSTKYSETIRTRLPAPVLSAATPTTQTVTAKWGAITGAKGYEISPDSGKTWIAVGKTYTYSHSGMQHGSSYFLMVRATDDAPCRISKISGILLKTAICPKITYTLYADSMVCTNAISYINFSKISSTRYSIGLNNTASKDTIYSFKVVKDTVVHFRITDSFRLNCGYQPVDINLHTVKLSPLHIHADAPFYCGAGSPASLFGDGNFEEYDIFKNGNLVNKEISNHYSTTSFIDGDRFVMVGLYRECVSDSSNAITVHKYTAPTASFTLKNTGKGIFNFSNKSKSEKSRIWYFGDGSSDTSANPVHNYNTNKIFTVWLVVTGQGGCKDSISKTLTTTGIATHLGFEGFSIRPNPFTDQIRISFSAINSGFLEIYLNDLQGRLIKNFPVQGIQRGTNEIIFSTKDVKPGQYFLILKNGDNIKTEHILKLGVE